MSQAIRIIAPAKINWTLEALHIRPDGYHELRSVLQTIALHDTITLTPGDDVTLDVRGDNVLADLPIEMNLAYRAALALRRRLRRHQGVHIELEKRIPVAAGLGGGSSDAAAVLRGLNRLWDAGQTEANLVELAGELGSDPPFFIAGGTAAISGRGERIEPLPDAAAPPLLLATPPAAERGEKTAAMYRALTPDDYADGYVTIGVQEIVAARRALVDEDLNNVFERVVGRVLPETEVAMDALRAQAYVPHLAGSGPSFFLLLHDGEPPAALTGRIRTLGFEPQVVETLPREQATAIEEL